MAMKMKTEKKGKEPAPVGKSLPPTKKAKKMMFGKGLGG